MNARRQQLLAYVIVVVLFLGGLTFIIRDSSRQDDALAAQTEQARIEVKAEVCRALRKSQDTLADLVELASTPRPEDTPAEADQRAQYRQDALERLAEDDECVGAAPPVDVTPTPPLPLGRNEPPSEPATNPPFVGSRGEKGEPGIDGTDGRDGAAGRDGADGAPGPVVDFTCTAIPGRLLDGTTVFNCQPVR